jgi:hypothetical protein
MKTPLKIKTPKKEIIKNMLNDEWVTLDAVIDRRISIELILMYQHGVVPLEQPHMQFEEFRFEHITIKEQIKAHELAMDKCMFNGQPRDVFYESLMVMHKDQLNILKNLQNLLITQYN